MEDLSRHGVLFHTHLRNAEAVDHVERTDPQVYLAPYGQHKLAAHTIVPPVFIRRINPEGFALSRLHQLGSCLSKTRIRSGITKVPDELRAYDLHLHGCGIRACIARGGP